MAYQSYRPVYENMAAPSHTNTPLTTAECRPPNRNTIASLCNDFPVPSAQRGPYTKHANHENRQAPPQASNGPPSQLGIQDKGKSLENVVSNMNNILVQLVELYPEHAHMIPGLMKQGAQPFPAWCGPSEPNNRPAIQSKVIDVEEQNQILYWRHKHEKLCSKFSKLRDRMYSLQSDIKAAQEDRLRLENRCIETEKEAEELRLRQLEFHAQQKVFQREVDRITNRERTLLTDVEAGFSKQQDLWARLSVDMVRLKDDVVEQRDRILGGRETYRELSLNINSKLIRRKKEVSDLQGRCSYVTCQLEQMMDYVEQLEASNRESEDGTRETYDAVSRDRDEHGREAGKKSKQDTMSRLDHISRQQEVQNIRFCPWPADGQKVLNQQPTADSNKPTNQSIEKDHGNSTAGSSQYAKYQDAITQTEPATEEVLETIETSAENLAPSTDYSGEQQLSSQLVASTSGEMTSALTQTDPTPTRLSRSLIIELASNAPIEKESYSKAEYVSVATQSEPAIEKESSLMAEYVSVATQSEPCDNGDRETISRPKAILREKLLSMSNLEPCRDESEKILKLMTYARHAISENSKTQNQMNQLNSSAKALLMNCCDMIMPAHSFTVDSVAHRISQNGHLSKERVIRMFDDIPNLRERLERKAASLRGESHAVSSAQTEVSSGISDRSSTDRTEPESESSSSSSVDEDDVPTRGPRNSTNAKRKDSAVTLPKNGMRAAKRMKRSKDS